MQKLDENQYEAARGLFTGLAEDHFSVGAVLACAARGEVWVDDPARPRVGLAFTSEGHYLAGDPERREAYPGLRQALPHNAYLTCEPGWESVLDQVWSNPFARKHPRQVYRFERQRIPDWQARVPPGYELAAVDRGLLRRTDLERHEEIAGRVEDWPSLDYFLQRGFGWVLLHGRTIASRCIADCAFGERCEMGVGTARAHQRRGLGSLVVAAALDECRRKGYQQIGWHCLASNRGSIGVALKTGFVKVKDYSAYSSVLPAENAGDLSVEECRDWAEHYERAAGEVGWYRFYAGGAWALAGDEARALDNLQRLVEGDWQGRPEWLEGSFMFESLQADPRFRALVSRQRQKQAQPRAS